VGTDGLVAQALSLVKSGKRLPQGLLIVLDAYSPSPHLD
jgi:hypothetical protein